MNRLKLVTAAVLSLFLSAGSAAGAERAKTAADEPKSPTFVPSELLVRFKLGKTEQGNAALRRIGARVLEKLSQVDISRLSLPKGMTVAAAARRLSAENFVDFVEPNYIQQAVEGPNDPRFKDQWGLTTVRAVAGWGVHRGSARTVVAIVDTGVDFNHPDLRGKIVSGYNFVEKNNRPRDTEGHGTHCAGIVAAATDNGEGIAGVCPNCSVMPIRGLGADGLGTVTTVAAGIVWAADHGANVISMSFGSPAYSRTLSDAVAYAVKKGVVMVAAAGNDGVSTPFYPAHLESVISVGSVTQFRDSRSYFSNYGDWVDVAAPGSSILSTVPGGYAVKHGTSMAAPFVAGVAALMTSCSGKGPAAVRKALMSSAVPVGDWVASGRIDLPRALAAVGCAAPVVSPPQKARGEHGEQGIPSQGGAPSTAPQTPKKDPKGPPSPVGQVVSFAIDSGRSIESPEGALSESDDRRIKVGSKGAGISSVLVLEFAVQMKAGVSYDRLTLSLEGYAENPGSFDVLFWSSAAGEWVNRGKIRLEGSEGVASLTVSDVAAYVTGEGAVKVRLSRKEKLWNGFELGLDRVRIEGSETDGTAKTPPAAGSNSEPARNADEAAREPKGDASADGAPSEKGDKEKSVTEKAKDFWNNFKKSL